jgi:hypothetical protein
MNKIFLAVVIMAFAATCAFAQNADLENKDAAPAVSAAPAAPAAPAASVAAKKEFNIFTEKYDLKNHYIPSGWMGDYGDIQIDDGCATTPHSGKTCLKVTYTAQGAQGAGWMGIYWQNPANNWGTQMGGYDLKGYNKLTFWARGDKGGETISEFKVGGINGNYADSDSTSMGPITLTKDWKQYTIDLKGMDLSYISGGFELSASAKDNAEGFVIYLDDMKYEE